MSSCQDSRSWLQTAHRPDPAVQPASLIPRLRKPTRTMGRRDLISSLDKSTAFPAATFQMNLHAINGSLFWRFAAVLAAYVQYGPDLGAVQKSGARRYPASTSLSSMLFQSRSLPERASFTAASYTSSLFFLRMFERARRVPELSQSRKGRRKVPMMLAPFLLFL